MTFSVSNEDHVYLTEPYCYAQLGKLDPRLALAGVPWTYMTFTVFFFQAEDGIRYLTVTGVQTCALPISTAPSSDLCSRWLPTALITTGNPSAAAATLASAAATSRERGTGTPKAASARLPSCSASVRAALAAARGCCSCTAAPRAQVSPAAPARSSASSASRWPCRGTMPAARHFSRVARGSDSGSEAITTPRVVVAESAAANCPIALR